MDIHIWYVLILQKMSILTDNPSKQLRTLLPGEVIGTLSCTIEYTAGNCVNTTKSVIMIVCWINMTRGKLTRQNTMVYPWLGCIPLALPQPCRIVISYYRKDSHWCCVTDWGTENYTGPLLPPSGTRITVYSHGHCVYRSITFIPPADWSYYFTLFNFICKTVFAVCKQNRISDSYYLHDLLCGI